MMDETVIAGQYMLRISRVASLVQEPSTLDIRIAQDVVKQCSPFIFDAERLNRYFVAWAKSVTYDVTVLDLFADKKLFGFDSRLTRIVVLCFIHCNYHP